MYLQANMQYVLITLYYIDTNNEFKRRTFLLNIFLLQKA